MKKTIDWVWRFLKDILIALVLFAAVFLGSGGNLGCKFFEWLTLNNKSSG